MSGSPVRVQLEPEAVLQSALEHARHLVPAQSPLDRFVHHNPLHAFEEEKFEEAVVHAARVYDNEPFWSEAAYQASYAEGRIWDVDLDDVLQRQVAPGLVAGVVERRELVRARLLSPIEPLSGESLSWHLTETDALEAARHDLSHEARARILAEAGGDEARAIKQLWRTCERFGASLGPPASTERPPGPRIRDRLMRAGLQDPDTMVAPLLIRWSGGFLDHGVAYWPMADRDLGFYRAFLAHFDQPLDLGRPWLSTLRTLVRRARQEEWPASRMCLHVLGQLGHAPGEWDAVVLDTLLALRGWSGMFQRLADRPDTAPERLDLPTDLCDVLAIRLALDLSAAEWLLRGRRGQTLVERCSELPDLPPEPSGTDRVWHLFQLAQILGLGGLTLAELGPARAGALLEASEGIGEIHRRQLWHSAYERRFRVEYLDAITLHAQRLLSEPEPEPEVRVQCSFCIDDREESLRRLLEEVAPWVETLGIAGNYGISMYYQGVEHGHPVALGPAGFEPRHLVIEQPVHGALQRSRWKGMLRHNLDVGSQTLLRGAMVTLGGMFSAVPLSLRLLAPKIHARLTRRDLPTQTTLLTEAHDDHMDHHGLAVGFTFEEKVEIVRETLELMSLVRGFAPLVVCLGHGSSSMNNPHEAAHDCGACGGGRGGPNARVFAKFANDPEVRRALARGGIHIPDQTWFVGGYHNTADDAVLMFDLDRVPAEHQALLGEIRDALDEARRLDALERCRKFENVPLDVSPEQALEHVENRDEDLAQPRPEYGHCTNALCLVGRRAWSKGLFLDRRAFLCSYDPDVDPDGQILSRLLAMAVPVGAGINLEYWFSVVDATGYGSGTKLPHNITGLVGVMDGHQSDLRTGLPWQMVELHEPVRLLCVVEASPQVLLEIASSNPDVGRLVTNGWVQLACLDPETGTLQLFDDGAFRPWEIENTTLPRVGSSLEWFRGTRGFLPPASITSTVEAS
ncbi:MAG TPA: DUF2309 family protein [Deltaproteobacteria bacterium]|nr:DUF2309 family protein [Deltaproteobacteria bacterium]